MTRKRSSHRHVSRAGYRPLRNVLRETVRAIGPRPHRLWRMRDAVQHVFRLLRNAADGEEVQILIDRANRLFLLLPVPRRPARHHVIDPPFRSSARSKLRYPENGF